MTTAGATNYDPTICNGASWANCGNGYSQNTTYTVYASDGADYLFFKGFDVTMSGNSFVGIVNVKVWGYSAARPTIYAAVTKDGSTAATDFTENAEMVDDEERLSEYVTLEVVLNIADWTPADFASDSFGVIIYSDADFTSDNLFIDHVYIALTPEEPAVIVSPAIYMHRRDYSGETDSLGIIMGGPGSATDSMIAVWGLDYQDSSYTNRLAVASYISGYDTFFVTLEVTEPDSVMLVTWSRYYWAYSDRVYASAYLEEAAEPSAPPRRRSILTGRILSLMGGK